MAWVLACTKVQGRSSFVKRMNCFCAKLYNLTVRSVQKRSFFSHSISLLPKIVTEAHANLKKNKTSCNTALSIMQSLSSTPLWNVRDRSSLICQPVVCSIYSSSIHHQSSYGLQCIITQCTFSPGALSFYELKEGRIHASCVLLYTVRRAGVFVGSGSLKGGAGLKGGRLFEVG